MSRGWQNLCFCVILHMLLPLLPLVVELWATKTISDSTITLAGTMYTIAIAVSSRNLALFGLGIVSSILLAVAFGSAASGGDSLPYSRIISSGAILVVFVFHLVERHRRHVLEGQPFLRFFGMENED